MRSRNISRLSMVPTEELSTTTQDPVFSPTRPFSNSHHSIRVILIYRLSNQTSNFHSFPLWIFKYQQSIIISNFKFKSKQSHRIHSPRKLTWKPQKNHTPKWIRKNRIWTILDLHYLGESQMPFTLTISQRAGTLPCGGFGWMKLYQGMGCSFGSQNDAGVTWGVFGYLG